GAAFEAEETVKTEGDVKVVIIEGTETMGTKQNVGPIGTQRNDVIVGVVETGGAVGVVSADVEIQRNDGAMGVVSTDGIIETMETQGTNGTIEVENSEVSVEIIRTIGTEGAIETQNVEYNEKICNDIMDKVKVADKFIEILCRRKHETEKNFRNMEYYLTFARFTDVMKRIKIFIMDVSQK
ncbi:309_t:CDS:2, partial [Funneliformis mosseae]